jgi:hypothetical protein
MGLGIRHIHSFGGTTNEVVSIGEPYSHHRGLSRSGLLASSVLIKRGYPMNVTGAGMSDQELHETLEALRQANERAKASPDEARRVLVEEGVYTEDGELTPEYR